MIPATMLQALADQVAPGVDGLQEGLEVALAPKGDLILRFLWSGDRESRLTFHSQDALTDYLFSIFNYGLDTIN